MAVPPSATRRSAQGRLLLQSNADIEPTPPIDFMLGDNRMTAVADKIYTPEDLLALPEQVNYELVDGHLVERPMSRLSSWVGARLFRLIDTHLEDRDLGWAWHADQGYTCFPGPRLKVRFPDVSFVRRERLPDGLTSDGYIEIAPDFAVEVISPNDLAQDVERKVVEYLNAGVVLVWVIYPEARTAYVYRRDGSVTWFRNDAELSGEDVLPGFACRLTKLFPAVDPAAPEAR